MVLFFGNNLIVPFSLIPFPSLKRISDSQVRFLKGHGFSRAMTSV